MGTCWPNVALIWNKLIEKHPDIRTITFSNAAHRVTKYPITNDINNYNSGGTHITSGFEEINKLLLNEKTDDNITIIFISDGADNDNSTLK